MFAHLPSCPFGRFSLANFRNAAVAAMLLLLHCFCCFNAADAANYNAAVATMLLMLRCCWCCDAAAAVKVLLCRDLKRPYLAFQQTKTDNSFFVDSVLIRRMFYLQNQDFRRNLFCAIANFWGIDVMRNAQGSTHKKFQSSRTKNSQFMAKKPLCLLNKVPK